MKMVNNMYSGYTGNCLGEVRVFWLFMTLISCGLLLPVWKSKQAYYVWEHTYIDGKRMTFTGNGWDFLKANLKIMFLSVITLSIYWWFKGKAFWRNYEISHVTAKG